MSAKKSITGWFTNHKATLLGVLVWVFVATLGGLATAFVPIIPPSNKLIDLLLAATVALNVVVVYIAFVGTARLVFKPSEGFVGSAKFVFRKDMLTTLAGVLLFAVALISLPPLATQGTWHIPTGSVAVIAFICSWIVISYAMKRIYTIQFFEEVLDEEESASYKSKLQEKPEKPERTGLFLVDINNSFRAGLNRITRIERKRTHKLIFPFVQSLFVLLSPAVFLWWSLLVFDLNTYTVFAAITAPAVMSLAAAVWAAWHVNGGFTRVVTKRVGRVMASNTHR